MAICARFFSTTPNKAKHYDIIVSGGGLIGTAITCLLAQTPLLSDRNILLIESSKPKQWSLPPNYSNRVSSINGGTKKLMEKLGAWEHISKTRFKPVLGMKVWDSSGSKVEFEHSINEPVAYIVENDVLVDSVMKQLKIAKNVTIMNECKVEQYNLPEKDQEHVELMLNDGSTISCNLLVGSDGANSAVRKAMAIQYLSWGYGQSAVVATLQLSEGSQNDIAWQRFLPTGPVALLPLTGDLCSLVWSTTPSEAKNLMSLSNESFVEILNRSLNEPVKYTNADIVSALMKQVLGLVNSKMSLSESTPQPPTITAVQDGSRGMFPLGFGHATSYVKPSVALIGDAAHRVHPLAGQGVNLGFGDVTCLVDQIKQSVQLGKEIGDLKHLKEYESQRQAHNVPLMLAIDLMARVYSSENPALRAAGNLALYVANTVTPIKALMMKRAAI